MLILQRKSYQEHHTGTAVYISEDPRQVASTEDLRCMHGAITYLNVSSWFLDEREVCVSKQGKWFNLYALRNLVKLQLTSNIFNIAIHLLLVIPWPYFGYTLNPGNFLWTIKNPVFCRLFIVVEDLISIFCSVSAVVIFGTNPKIQELGQERIRKMAFCASWCWISVGLGAMFVSSFREIVPLLKHGNCPSHPFIILCGRKEI